ncbi:hypothetical protein [Alicyclobacillus sp. ALC3]|uniref:hypothetical protein n=1 Tax=Alicyclobacillus sp. ALC3 TaxID=2796143 RepID=UPI002379577F|nr:hypothetical protein [Alicyclobacillus sp. ALC3]WDL96925.1 hypothetical protein JC200_22045 [Alicyclobacillus sp. ALC3]
MKRKTNHKRDGQRRATAARAKQADRDHDLRVGLGQLFRLSTGCVGVSAAASREP